VSIENLRVDLGSVVTDFLTPIAQRISSVVAPIKPIIDALDTPVQGLDSIPLFKANPTLRGMIDKLIEVSPPIPTPAYAASFMSIGNTIGGPIGLLFMAKGQDYLQRFSKGENFIKLEPINWSFIDAAKFAVNLPDEILKMGGMGGEMPIGSIYDILGNTRYVSYLSKDMKTVDPSIAGTLDLSNLGGMALTEVNKALAGVGMEVSKVEAKSTGYKVTERSGFQFLPYVLDIGNWTKIFKGDSAILFTYEMPKLEFAASFDVGTTIPIPIPVLNAALGVNLGIYGSAAASVDLAFGYDTYGIQKSLQTQNWLNVLDGFYVNDFTMPSFKDGKVVPGTGGQEKPELTLNLSLGLQAGLTLLSVIKVGVGGEIKLKADFDLNDIKTATITRDANGQVVNADFKGDGKIRPSEIITMLSYVGTGSVGVAPPGIFGTSIGSGGSIGYPGLGPLNLFDIKVTSSISAYIWAQVPVFGEYRFTVAKLDLPTLTINAPIIQPYLGTVNNGELTLYSGSRSGSRAYIDTTDSAERWVLSGGQNGVVQVQFQDGYYMTFNGVSRVVADLGQGNDTFDASHLLGTVTVDVRGGEGNDTILTGMGGGRVEDNQGNNTLKAVAESLASVTFITGAGDDKLIGGAGNDILYAGQGSNQLVGGAGNDTLYAVLGSNRLTGGDGVDRYVMVGSLGVNSLVESGSEGSVFDLSGFVPAEIAALTLPVGPAPSVSIPASFNATRDQKSRILFSGAAFAGDVNVKATVLLSIDQGIFSAISADGVTVEGKTNGGTSDRILSFTGSLADLNRYFTSQGKITYVYKTDSTSQLMTVTISQNGLSSQATATIKRVNSSDNLKWGDLAVQDNLLVAVANTVDATQTGIQISRDAGFTWQAANVTKGKGYDYVSISSNGQNIAALASDGSLAVSKDAGLTWGLSTVPNKNSEKDFSEVLITNEGRIFIGNKPGSYTYPYTYTRPVLVVLGAVILSDQVTETRTAYTDGWMSQLPPGSSTWQDVPGSNSNWNAMAASNDGSVMLAAAGVGNNNSNSGSLNMGRLTTVVTEVRASPLPPFNPFDLTALAALQTGKVTNLVDGSTGTNYINQSKAGSG
ncbi:MAG: hypothetical protein ACR2HF_04020, partial [Methylococcaceae bacterium]